MCPSPSKSLSRALSLGVRRICVEKERETTEIRFEEMVVGDQQQRSWLKNSQLSLVLAPPRLPSTTSPSQLTLVVLSESTNLRVSLPDALWWHSHVSTVGNLLAARAPRSPRRSPPRVFIVSAEFSQLNCEMADLQSTPPLFVHLQLLSIASVSGS